MFRFFCTFTAMLKKLQISLTYLGMLIILMHGAIPHHHHEAFSEPGCLNRVIHTETQHHCDFSSHDHDSSKELICHFFIEANKFSIAKYFISVSSVLLPIAGVQPNGESSGHIPLFSGKRVHLSCFLRAPPQAA